MIDRQSFWSVLRPLHPTSSTNAQIDPHVAERYFPVMTVVESITESSDDSSSDIPQMVPDAEWRTAAYNQFLRDDSAEDDIYERFP